MSQTEAVRTVTDAAPPRAGLALKHNLPITVTVSVIIPVRTVTPELREAIDHLVGLTPPADEIIVVPDRLPAESLPAAIRLLPYPGGPAAKRDAAARHAHGQILAFLDDDAYPRADWLKRALPHFTEAAVAAVGGPAVTPPREGLWADVSGAVLTSWLGSGPTRRRYWPTGTVRAIDDWPSVNLLVRADVFRRVGGFDTDYWPGEDTKLCLDIVQAGGRLRYDPAVVCYHHRATTPAGHLKQVGRYGLHRGHFVRRFPATSRRLAYFLPSLALAGAAAVAGLAAAVPVTRLPLVLVVAALAVTTIVFGLIEARRSRQWLVAVLYPGLLLLTHLTYSTMFIRGLLSHRLPQYQRTAR